MNAAADTFTLHQLRVFCAVARTGSFTRAAEELHVSQPAVTMHVKQLERALGVQLLVRSGRSVRFTEAGQTLYEGANRAFSLLEETLAELDAYRGLRRGTLRLAADTTAGVHVVPPYLARFRQLHPDIAVRLAVTNRTEVARRLLLGEVELAVIGRLPEDERLAAEPFLANELVVVAPAGHPLAGRRLTPADLAGESFLLREEGSGTRATAERFLTEAGVSLRPTMELGSNSAVVEAVAHGLGIAVISRRAAQRDMEAGRLVTLDVEGFPLVRHWHLAWRRGPRLSPAAEAFRRLLLPPPRAR